MLRRLSLLILTPMLWLSAVSAFAQPIEVETTTMDGVVPGTAISYTITATGTAREIWAPAMSDSGTWEWMNGFPEFVTVGTQTLTVDFSSPVDVNRLVFGVNSISTGPFTLTVSGGTATTNDFDVEDGLTAVGGAGPASFDAATGEFTITGGDQSLMVGSTSSNTITQLSITGDGGGDGYTLFFGVTTVAPAVPAVEVPALGTAGGAMLLSILLLVGIVMLRRTVVG